jgi:hypothetical protein
MIDRQGADVVRSICSNSSHGLAFATDVRRQLRFPLLDGRWDCC